MLFCSQELCRRIEKAECALVRDSATLGAARRPADFSLIREIAGGVAIFAGTGSPLSKVAGLGFDGVPSNGDLAEVEQVMAENGMPVVVELSTLADTEVGTFLTERGYRLHGHENILARSLTPHDHADSAEVTTAAIGDDEGDAWLETVVTGFASPDSQGVQASHTFPREMIENAIRDMLGLEGFRRYGACRSGDTAGGASMRMFEGVVNLCGAATLPEHRRKGVQSALYHRRLADAANAGCDLAVVTTQPGSKS